MASNDEFIKYLFIYILSKFSTQLKITHRTITDRIGQITHFINLIYVHRRCLVTVSAYRDIGISDCSTKLSINSTRDICTN